MQNYNQLYLQNCEHEPIHLIGHIQDQGLLLAVDQAQQITYASANVAQFLNITPQALAGKTMAEVGLKTSPGPAEDIRIVNRNGTEFELIRQPAHAFELLELEPLEPIPTALSSTTGHSIQRILHSESQQQLLQNTAEEVARIAQYDRTMIYRFHDDWHGEVVAEINNGRTGPDYLGLHYPATDIPQRARDLFTLNPIRLIQDVASAPVPLLALVADAPPLDLSHSTLRSSSPVHLEYLKNMGVRASLTISLLVNGRLWGLIACHHSTPRWVNSRTRSQCHQVALLFSGALKLHQAQSRNARVQHVSRVGGQLAHNLMDGTSVTEALTQRKATVQELVPCAGVAVCVAGETACLGQTPPPEQLQGLVQWLRNNQAEAVFATDGLSEHWPQGASLKNTAAGIISMAVARDQGDFIIWFRPEILRTVSWGGNPAEPAQVTETTEGTKISPRLSFAKWSETVANHAEPWADADIGAVARLHEDVLQVLVQRAAKIRRLNEELKQAYQQLDTFSYTVSHDLRTPLNAVKVYAEILQDELHDAAPSTARKAAAKIGLNANRMAELIDAVLAYSRVEKSTPHFTQVNVQNLLPPIMDDLRVVYQTHPVTFEIGALPPLQGDAAMIGQVFSNLLSNAVKYSSGKPTPTVRVMGEEEQDRVIYRVEDNGIGIDPEDADSVFQIFTRLSAGKAAEGHGVGMTIAKKIMERHAGDIWFEGKPGEGTTFFVAFPKRPLSKAPHQEHRP